MGPGSRRFDETRVRGRHASFCTPCSVKSCRSIDRFCRQFFREIDLSFFVGVVVQRGCCIISYLCTTSVQLYMYYSCNADSLKSWELGDVRAVERSTARSTFFRLLFVQLYIIRSIILDMHRLEHKLTLSVYILRALHDLSLLARHAPSSLPGELLPPPAGHVPGIGLRLRDLERSTCTCTCTSTVIS